MKNPYINALVAFTYILSIAFFIQVLPQNIEHLLPMFAIATMLSLLVLSVSVMGFLFFYTPGKLFLEKEYTAAITFFTKTVGTFVGLIVLLLLFIFFMV